ncbi:hypothetical protein HMSP1_2 [Sinorhizobium phage HMSP1-Susan]|nr:hypothetical protein HMSP1_2 [Sinorhizobium phage HMSP1-Susan]
MRLASFLQAMSLPPPPIVSLSSLVWITVRNSELRTVIFLSGYLQFPRNVP